MASSGKESREGWFHTTDLTAKGGVNHSCSPSNIGSTAPFMKSTQAVNDPDAFSKAFKRLALAAGCPQNTRLHDVRHAVASLLLLNGLSPLEASRHMGHASSTFTMDTYGHVLDAENDRAAKALERAFEEKA